MVWQRINPLTSSVSNRAAASVVVKSISASTVVVDFRPMSRKATAGSVKSCYGFLPESFYGGHFIRWGGSDEKILARKCCGLGIVGTASAADLGIRRPFAAPPVALFSWSGCYIGGYVGGAWNERDATFTDLGNSTFQAFSGGIVSGRREGTHSWNAGLDDSFIGGGTLGCNWQPFGSPFVFGVEGEIGFLNLEGSAFDPLLSPTLPVTAVRATPDVLGTARIGDWYGMITGRLGYAGWDRVLLYVKGGAALFRFGHQWSMAATRSRPDAAIGLLRRLLTTL